MAPGSEMYCNTTCTSSAPSLCANQDLNYTCSEDVCGYETEPACDGVSNDSAGTGDSGTCDPDGPCMNYRTDPVHVGTGAYLSHPLVDVRFQGTRFPIEFVRGYTSMDGWPATQATQSELDRLGQGWFHTYDEMLYAADGLGWPDPDDAAFIHRTARGRGRRFVCSTSGTAGGCTTNDGSLDTLGWDSTNSVWVLEHGSGGETRFIWTGQLYGHGRFNGSNVLLEGWTVSRHTSDQRIDYVEDE
ncbi:MAG: DUF6531 domain-containing protein [Sandaracinaceae bacterium]